MRTNAAKKKTITFGNHHTHTSIFTMVVNEHTFHMANLLRIGVAGHGGFFAFSVTTDTATINHGYPDSGDIVLPASS